MTAPGPGGQPAATGDGGEELLAAWLGKHPAARGWQAPDGTWRGSCPVSGSRALSTGACATPGDLAAALEGLLAACAEVRLIEAGFPGWLARRWPAGNWTAVLPRGDVAAPLAVSAPDAAGLRAAIREVQP